VVPRAILGLGLVRQRAGTLTWRDLGGEGQQQVERNGGSDVTSRRVEVVFDLDGTLSNPIEGIGRSLNHALGHHGFESVSRDRVAELIGPPLDQMFRDLTGMTDLDEIQRLVKTYRERYSTIGYRESVLYSGVREALQDLQRAGALMGVCTSKRGDYATWILEMFEIRHFFEFVDGGDVGIEKWQQLAGLRERGAVDGGSVMIGDRAVDISAAHRNGLTAGGVLWGFGSREELEGEAPEHFFQSPGEWIRLIPAERIEALKREGTGR
jgi:phosphoglycolate phosphatase